MGFEGGVGGGLGLVEGGGLLLAGAALALVGEEGHEGDVGLGVLAEGGVGEASGGDGLGVGEQELGAERAGHRATYQLAAGFWGGGRGGGA